MGDIHIYDEGLYELEVDVSGAPGRVQRGMTARLAGPVRRRLEREMKIDASGHRRLPHFADAIGSTMMGPLELEVGFDKRGQGELANIIVYGSINNAPVYDFQAGPRRAIPGIIDDIADMAEDAVLDDEGHR